MEIVFGEELTQYEEEMHMPYVTSVERVGIKKGQAMARLEGIELGLRLKFGERGVALLPEIREIKSEEKLKTVLDAIESASSPDDLRRLWAG